MSLVVGLVGVSMWLSPLAAAAQEQAVQTKESILLTPTAKHYSLESGTSTRDSFDIVNDGQTEFTFVVYARPYSVKDSKYQPDFVTSARNADAYKWIQFDQSSYVAKPGQTVKVNYTLRVPAGTAPGGHYGVMFAETQPKNTTEGTAIIRNKRVGAILYTTVKGDVITDGTMKATTVPLFQFSAPLTIRSTVGNSGNTDFQVKSSVQVSDLFGNIKYRADKELTVLPDKPREIINDWSNPAWIGVYKVVQINKFLDTTKSSDNYVLLIPAWVYIAFVVLIAGRILYAVALRRQKK